MFLSLNELHHLLARHADNRHVIAVKPEKIIDATLEIGHKTVCEIVDEKLSPLHVENNSHTLAISHLLVVAILHEAPTDFALTVELNPVVLLYIVDECIALAYAADESQIAHVAPSADVVGEDVLGCLVAL